jgi:hypothetical protein
VRIVPEAAILATAVELVGVGFLEARLRVHEIYSQNLAWRCGYRIVVFLKTQKGNRGEIQ